MTTIGALGARGTTEVLVGELVDQTVGSSIVVLLLLLLWGLLVLLLRLLLCLLRLRSVGLLCVQIGLLLLDGRSVGVVCEVALVGEATVHTRLGGTPDFLLSLRIGEGLRKGRRGGGIGAALFSAAKVLSALESKVELQSVGLLLVVGVHACCY